MDKLPPFDPVGDHESESHQIILSCYQPTQRYQVLQNLGCVRFAPCGPHGHG
jgi:hypothetical protein